jgi:hypothetical protein
MAERSNAPSNRLAVKPPSRDAEHNQPLADQMNPVTEDILLPSLDDGITLLDIEDGRGVPIIQSLVLDHLLLHEGPAFWVDANGHATTTSLARVAPSQRLLDRIHVARGFTAYQHYSAVCGLPTAVNQYIQQSAADSGTGSHQPPRRDDDSPQTPSLIVAPAIDTQYRADDTLGETHKQTLQARTLARLRAYADGYDVPVLLTRSRRDEFTASIKQAADQQIACEQTRMGPRFVGDEFETLVYPVDDGAYYQTTFAYWQQLLSARAKHIGLEPTPTATEESMGVGTGVVADGTTATFTADPLHDVWTNARVGGR